MGISTTPTSVARLARRTYEHFLAARSAMRQGDWATYGKELDYVGAGLQELANLTRTWEGQPVSWSPFRPAPPPVKRR